MSRMLSKRPRKLPLGKHPVPGHRPPSRAAGVQEVAPVPLGGCVPRQHERAAGGPSGAARVAGWDRFGNMGGSWSRAVLTVTNDSF